MCCGISLRYVCRSSAAKSGAIVFSAPTLRVQFPDLTAKNKAIYESILASRNCFQNVQLASFVLLANINLLNCATAASICSSLFVASILLIVSLNERYCLIEYLLRANIELHMLLSKNGELFCNLSTVPMNLASRL